mgnify:FL=1
MRVDKKKSGSAMIIVMSLVSLVTVVVAGVSGQLLAEHNANNRFLDALVAQYGAQAGVWWGLALKNEADGGNREITLNHKEGGGEIISRGEMLYSPQDDVSLSMEREKTRTLSVEGSGNLGLRLEEISPATENDCPLPRDIFVYLLVEDQSGGKKTLNSLANSAGVWREGNSDHVYYLPLPQSEVSLTPIFARSFIPAGQSLGVAADYILPAKCLYATKWKLSPAQNQSVNNVAVIRGEGLYRESKQTISISKP